MSNAIVKAAFRIGARVQLSPLANQIGGFHTKRGTFGVVSGYGRGPKLIRVLRDGAKQASTYHCCFWELYAEPSRRNPKESTYRIPTDRFPPMPIPKP